MHSIKSSGPRNGLSKLEISDYHGYLQILNEKLWKGLTPLDLFSLRGITQVKLRHLVLRELGISDKSEEGEVQNAVKRIHNIYNTSIHELTNTFLLKVPDGIMKPKWYTSKNETPWDTIDAFVHSMYEVLNGKVE